jgi:hypothetical protein
LSFAISQIRDQPVVGQLIPDCYVELEKIILSERKNVPIEFPVIDRKRLLQLVKENQLQLDENELPHAVHFLNESGLCAVSYFLFQCWVIVICKDVSECYIESIFKIKENVYKILK